MKILYIGHYREKSHWGQSARNNILALQSAGVEVLCRNIPVSNDDVDLPDSILQSEKHPLKNIDACIQHVLPAFFVGSNKFKKNIGFSEIDSLITNKHVWFSNYKLMDEIWTTNKESCECFKSLGIKSNIIPYSFDKELTKKDYPSFSMRGLNNQFKFYCIANSSEQSNLITLIKTYLNTFKIEDNVCLVINTYEKDIDPEKTQKDFFAYIQSIKQSMRLYKNLNHYPDILNIPHELTYEQRQAFHNTCDCFVDVSKSFRWSSHVFEALLHKNYVVSGDKGGCREFLEENKECGLKLVEGSCIPCFDRKPAIPSINKSNEVWFNINEVDLANSMKYYFEQKPPIEECSKIQNFSHEQIGRLMKELINE